MKQKKGKRLLSLLVTLAMVIGLMQGMTLTAYAQIVCPGCHSSEYLTYFEQTQVYRCDNSEAHDWSSYFLIKTKQIMHQMKHGTVI